MDKESIIYDTATISDIPELVRLRILYMIDDFGSLTDEERESMEKQLPVYDDKGELERYNIFHASMLVRHSNDGKLYLYDVIDIKKETSNSLGE